MKLSEVDQQHVQAYADRMLAAGAQPSTVRNAIVPLQVIFRWKLSRGVVAVNPAVGLDLPAVRATRDRIASPVEAARLLAALPVEDRPLWATALYAGLRRGELMGVRWADIDLVENVIRVEQAWDPKEKLMVEPKSKAGLRKVPIAGALRGYLAEPKLAGEPDQLAFAVGGKPFNSSSIVVRAHRIWRAAKLEPIGLHQCRHTFASMMIAAGVNAKAISTYMGHSNISITLDLYGHLMPGNEAQAAGMLDDYLEAAQVAEAQAPAFTVIT